MTIKPKANPYICASVGIISASTLYFFWKWYSKKEKMPENWQKVGTLKDLMCFPVKSCGVIRFPSMECSVLGLKHDWLYDRKFLLIEESGNFISARNYPQLMLVQPSIDGDMMVLNAPNMETCTFNAVNISEKKLTKIVMWSTHFSGVDCGDKVAKWISRFLTNEDKGFRMVFFPNKENMRRSRIPIIINHIDSGTYQDLTSYNLINENSIKDLNSRLDNCTVDPQNFRPNFVINDGVEAYAEDVWKWVRIGEVVFKVAKLCTRCTMTTIDYNTGIKNKDMEPLTTLKKYRMIGTKKYDLDSPAMGLHLVLYKGGVVNLGDDIYIA